MSPAGPALVKGRSCGTCTLCCKVLAIPEVPTPRDQWCRHCRPGEGCGIYEQRPEPCRTFHCGYLLWDVVPDHWFPARSKIVIVNELGMRLNFYVDSSTPGRWREAPWYNEIKAMAVMAFGQGQQVLVTAGRKVTAMLPDREVELGVVGEHEIVITGRRPDGTWGAAMLDKDDPRMALGGATVPLL